MGGQLPALHLDALLRDASLTVFRRIPESLQHMLLLCLA